MAHLVRWWVCQIPKNHLSVFPQKWSHSVSMAIMAHNHHWWKITSFHRCRHLYRFLSNVHGFFLHSIHPHSSSKIPAVFLEDFFPVELRLLVISSTGVGHIVPMFLSYCCFIHTWSADCCVSMVYEPREPCNGPKCKEETTMNDAVRTAACAQWCT